MNMFMIAVHINNRKKIIGYRITDIDSGEVKDYDYDAVKAVLEKGININGLKLDNGKVIANDVNLKGSKSYDRYTQLIGNIPVGMCTVVITKEYPNRIYDVCNHFGQVARMTLNDIMCLDGLANAKLVHDNENGDYLVSLYEGIEKDKIFAEMAYAEKTKSKMLMLGMKTFEFDENNYARSGEDKTEKVVIGRGCLGIAEKGFFNRTDIVKVGLPSTCINFGVGAFMKCKSLVKINIPEGTTVIPKYCFSECSSLEIIELPNSIRKIDSYAFRNCNKLKEISIGPVMPVIDRLTLPRNARITIRR